MKIGAYPIDPFFIEAASIFLITFGSFALFVLCWNLISRWGWVKSLLISARDKAEAEKKEFQGLATQIRETRDKFVKARVYLDKEAPINRYEMNAEMADIGIKLKRYGLGVPESTEGDNIARVIDLWRVYLSVLLPLSEMADIDKAKAISITDKGVDLALWK